MRLAAFLQTLLIVGSILSVPAQAEPNLMLNEKPIAGRTLKFEAIQFYENPCVCEIDRIFSDGNLETYETEIDEGALSLDFKYYDMVQQGRPLEEIKQAVNIHFDGIRSQKATARSHTTHELAPAIGRIHSLRLVPLCNGSLRQLLGRVQADLAQVKDRNDQEPLPSTSLLPIDLSFVITIKSVMECKK